MVEKAKLIDLDFQIQERREGKWKTLNQMSYDIPFCSTSVIEEPLSLYESKTPSLEEYIAFRKLYEKGIQFAFDNPIDNLDFHNGGLTSPLCRSGEFLSSGQDSNQVDVDIRNIDNNDGDESGPLPLLGGEGSGSGRVLRDWLVSGDLDQLLGGEGSGAGRVYNWERPGSLQMNLDFLNPNQQYIWTGFGLFDHAGVDHLPEVWSKASLIEVQCLGEEDSNDE